VANVENAEQSFMRMTQRASSYLLQPHAQSFNQHFLANASARIVRSETGTRYKSGHGVPGNETKWLKTDKMRVVILFCDIARVNKTPKR